MSNSIKPSLIEAPFPQNARNLTEKVFGRTLGTPCKQKSLNQIIDHMDLHLDKIKEYNSVKRTQQLLNMEFRSIENRLDRRISCFDSFMET